jgi:hypothetical protein
VHASQLARVTPDDVESRFPGWHGMVDRPEDVIAEAFDLVRRDGRLHRSIRRARHAFALRELVIIAAHVIATESSVLFRGMPHGRLAEAEQRYQTRLADLVRIATMPAPAPVPPSWRRPIEPPRETEHAGVVGAMMEWVGRNPLDNQVAFTRFQVEWVPRLKTAVERAAAVMFLRTLQLPKHWRKMRDRLVARLDALRD